MRKLSAIIVIVSISLSLAATDAATATNLDIDILTKALKKALGEKTNVGEKRVLSVQQQIKAGKKTLVIVLYANSSPTTAGLRHGAFSDIVHVLKILKSWNWSDKVEQTMIGEYYSFSKGNIKKTQPIVMCRISSERLKGTNWNSIDPNRIAGAVDELELDDSVR